MVESPDVLTLVEGLTSPSDSERKFAVFKLQNLLGDPSFADAFIQADGLLPLRDTVLQTTGNTQAYALGSIDALLELDLGWECCDGEVLEKAVVLAMAHPLVNIVRNALNLLVLTVARPLSSAPPASLGHHGGPPMLGFQAIKPALDNHPDFLASLVHRLNASDHTLCANALQLLNALMRDAVVHGGEHEWPKFIKRLQDLGVIGGVGMLMRGDAGTDPESPLAAAILEFEGLTKLLLRKWKEVPVNVELSEHKRALKTVHLLSKPEPYNPTESPGTDGKVRRHHPEKWRRLGFETESPAWEFDETGYLGIMDLVEFVRRNEDPYQKILMEQSVQPKEQRCPLARASLSVTLILYEHFEIDETTEPDYLNNMPRRVAGTSGDDSNHLYRPLLLQWGRLHTAAMLAFVRIWKDAGAQQADFYKIEEVVRILVERIVGTAGRKTEIGRVEEDLRVVNLATARAWQMENLEEVYQDAWGPHLVQIREQLHHESSQFMKEQRIRCMLQGSWFPASSSSSAAATASAPSTSAGAVPTTTSSEWRFVRLSPNRRWLHYATFPARTAQPPALADLPETLDLNLVTSVDSNVSANEASQFGAADHPLLSTGPSTTATTAPGGKATTTQITIFGSPRGRTAMEHDPDERVLLELYPATAALASEWLDGLLMLLNQRPITKDTTRLIDMVEDWGVRLRILNLRWEDVDWEALEESVRGDAIPAKEVPSREGLGEEYWYAMPAV